VRRTTVALVLGIAVAALAGCSPTKGQPSPGGSSSESGAPSSSDNSPPPITQPTLDVSKYESSACSALTASQLQPLGASESGSAQDGTLGPECQWDSVDALNGNSVSFTVLTKSHGLDSLYQNRDNLAVFRPIQVGGYPAVDSDTTDAAHGSCATSVGTAQSSGFEISVSVEKERSPEYKAPCAVSEKIADTVLGNLKGGG
jgi:hypothetical protein